MRSPSRWSHTSSTNASSDSWSVSAAPSSSIRNRRSPSGSSTAPRWAPEARTRPATRSQAPSRSKLDDAAGGGVRVHRQHVGAQLGQHVRHDEGGGAVAVVDHQLEAGPAMAGDVDGALEGDGVVLERPGREVDVADLLGQHPAVVLPLEQALDLALGVLGDVGARGCRRSARPRSRGRRGAAAPTGRRTPRGDRTRKRVTGIEATSRSSTLTPAALRPAIIARFSIRADRLESREVTTVVPLRRLVP